jgi:hypothetical protein
MVTHAKEQAQQIGRGSSQVAFVVPYQGRNTVLKVAVNNKDLVQNEEEVRLFGVVQVIEISVNNLMVM